MTHTLNHSKWSKIQFMLFKVNVKFENSYKINQSDYPKATRILYFVEDNFNGHSMQRNTNKLLVIICYSPAACACAPEAPPLLRLHSTDWCGSPQARRTLIGAALVAGSQSLLPINLPASTKALSSSQSGRLIPRCSLPCCWCLECLWWLLFRRNSVCWECLFCPLLIYNFSTLECGQV